MRTFVFISVLMLLLPAAGAAAELRRQVGQVAGIPVFADQMEGEDRQQRADKALELFMRPVLQQWQRQHAAELRVTDAEASKLEAQILAYAACSKNGYALPEDPEWRARTLGMFGSMAKVPALLYTQYGGGRLLFQQGGTEAFDATRRLLEQRESEGAFTITDPEVRALAYDYWTRDHGAMLITDPAVISRALSIESVVSKCPGA